MLINAVHEYLALRRSAGFGLRSEGLQLKSFAAFCLSAASSASVNVARPSSSFGRSNGVAALCDQTPDRSGWPSAARGTSSLAPAPGV